ncbi:gp011L [Rabbit fibroma virus]|uniref:Gp011L n=1 Tax=Rabbit fibroma virus (strain Kasza) TaxID=10272 RepID=Q9Q959_RFVKA|nr:gp011L [Rabbit fibroma virus]AAF17895.1 gp011L [Rabbit fibroma virus]
MSRLKEVVYTYLNGGDITECTEIDLLCQLVNCCNFINNTYAKNYDVLCDIMERDILSYNIENIKKALGFALLDASPSVKLATLALLSIILKKLNKIRHTEACVFSDVIDGITAEENKVIGFIQEKYKYNTTYYNKRSKLPVYLSTAMVATLIVYGVIKWRRGT